MEMIMRIKRRLMRWLEKATCDKYELNRVILNYKKRFHEACSVLDGHEKPKRKER